MLLDTLFHIVVQFFRISKDLVAKNAGLRRFHVLRVGLCIAFGIELLRQCLHLAGIDVIVLRLLYGGELIDDVEHGCRTTIDIADVGKEEVAHEATAHDLFRADLARDEHHLLGIELLHLAVLVLTDDGEEVE